MWAAAVAGGGSVDQGERAPLADAVGRGALRAGRVGGGEQFVALGMDREEAGRTHLGREFRRAQLTRRGVKRGAVDTLRTGTTGAEEHMPRLRVEHRGGQAGENGNKKEW